MSRRIVPVRRRRRDETTEPGERERASTPSRGEREQAEEKARTTSQRPSMQLPVDQGASPPQIPLAGLLQLLGGGKVSLPMLIAIVAILLLCSCLFLYISSQFRGDEGTVLDMPTQPSILVEATASPVPTRTPTPSTQLSLVTQTTTSPTATRTAKPTAAATLAPVKEGTWLVMLYQDADDKILEQDIYLDLNEAERVGSSERLQIVAQVDRFRAGYQGDGDWHSTKRFYVTRDQDLQRVSSKEIADLGEANMADGGTLVDFVTWAIKTYPADKHVLILSDHGMGWPGGWSDPAPGGRGPHNVTLAQMGDMLFLMEIDEALQEIRDRTGLDQFELIGLDACLMGHIEVFATLAPHARYAVASQETEPSLGWAYASFLSALRDNPAMDGAELGRLIVESYIEEDQRIVDDEARAELLLRGSPMGGLFGIPTAQQLAQQMAGSTTLAAVNLRTMPTLMNSVNELSYALQKANQQNVAKARSYAQSFTSVFGEQVPPSYIDLGNFAQLLKAEGGNRDVANAADGVLAALNQAIIAEKHGRKKPAASGISIYFPNSQLYRTNFAGAASYTTIASRFAAESLWDDFLAYHYTGKRFERSAGVVAVPESSATVIGPGSGKVTVSPVSLSSKVATPGQPIVLSADIRGEKIGYVQLFVGFYDQAANSVLLVDSDYLESADTREIDGLFYPDWGEGDFTIEFEWEPIVFAINDGQRSVPALFRPLLYGASPEEAVYTVDGIYTYADGGESRYARLYFSNGVLRQVFGFTGEGGTGSPREIIPSVGDTFTVLDKWLDLDATGNVQKTVMLEGETLTFSNQMFTWKEMDAAPGQYVVGFIVQDLDGNAYESFQIVTVR